MSAPRPEAPFAKPRGTPWLPPRGLGAVVDRWRGDSRVWRNVVLEEVLPPRPARLTPLPEALDERVRAALVARNISQLYSHQAEAYALASAGRDLVVATPTASGKSLCFHLPVLDRLAKESQARALYLFPTKALSRDQEDAVRALLRDAGLSHGAVTFDGDTPGDARRAARERSSVLLTNPDMLHAGILPHHASWARLFSNLRYVVLDELHTYRGVFGSHLANVLRRLDRVARFHGSSPTFVFASATIGNPAEHAARMLGRPVSLVSENGAPAGPRHLLVYNPPVVNAELGIRASTIKTASRLTADLVRGGVSTLLFGQSRNGVEVMLKYLRDELAGDPRVDPSTLQGYRGGYLPGTRRNTESALREGAVRCVVATNALELGIDIGALDAVVCAGYPGSMAALWQRFGRAGRRGEASLALLIHSSAPLDQYLAGQPELIVGSPVEQARIDPDNVEILIQHLKCASFELPFEEGEPFRDVPESGTHDALEYLAQHQVLHPVSDSGGKRVYHWATETYPANHVSLRSVGWDNVVVIDERQESLAEMDWRSAHTMLHEQAIYQHDGEQYQVERFDLENRKAYVRKVAPDYFTEAMTYTRVSVISEEKSAALRWNGPALPVSMGEVSVVTKVAGYKKIKFHTHENVGYGEVQLPELQMHTSALWVTVPETVIQAMPVPRPSAIDAVRGLSTAIHTVACLGLMADPHDLGRTLGSGSETEGLPGRAGHDVAKFAPTLFIYDSVAGGVGLAARLFEECDELLHRAGRLIRGCACPAGCPGCIGPEIGAPAEPGHSPTPRKQVVLDLLTRIGLGN